MTNKDIESTLRDLAQETLPSRWQEKAASRRENGSWLKKSIDIALRVLDALDEKQMSKTALAEKMNVSRQQINKIVKGQENLTLKTISALEEALGIELITIPEQAPKAKYNLFQYVNTETLVFQETKTFIKSYSSESEVLLSATIWQEPPAPYFKSKGAVMTKRNYTLLS